MWLARGPQGDKLFKVVGMKSPDRRDMMRVFGKAVCKGLCVAASKESGPFQLHVYYTQLIEKILIVRISSVVNMHPADKTVNENTPP